MMLIFSLRILDIKRQNESTSIEFALCNKETYCQEFGIIYVLWKMGSRGLSEAPIRCQGALTDSPKTNHGSASANPTSREANSHWLEKFAGLSLVLALSQRVYNLTVLPTSSSFLFFSP